MNYTKIYKSLIERAKFENRKKGNGVYYESHHIIPDFMFKERKRKGPKGHLSGNPNDKENLVLLTEREHILAHILLAKSLKENDRYWAQAASSITYFLSFDEPATSRQSHRIAGSMLKYERYRKLAVAGISKARKGKMPVIDATTKEFIGSVLIGHPKVLSGEWVHHSTGKHTYINTQTNEKIYCSIDDPRIMQLGLKGIQGAVNGEFNPRFSGITNEEFLFEYKLLRDKLGNIPSLKFFRKVYFEKTGLKFPSSLSKFRFNHGKDLFIILEKETGYTYDKYQKWCGKLIAKDYI